ncbi:hypothetical protein Q7P37_005270 [Cladosporium fusiforme]
MFAALSTRVHELLVFQPFTRPTEQQPPSAASAEMEHHMADLPFPSTSQIDLPENSSKVEASQSSRDATPKPNKGTSTTSSPDQAEGPAKSQAPSAVHNDASDSESTTHSLSSIDKASAIHYQSNGIATASASGSGPVQHALSSIDNASGILSQHSDTYNAPDSASVQDFHPATQSSSERHTSSSSSDDDQPDQGSTMSRSSKQKAKTKGKGKGKAKSKHDSHHPHRLTNAQTSAANPDDAPKEPANSAARDSHSPDPSKRKRAPSTSSLASTADSIDSNGYLPLQRYPTQRRSTVVRRASSARSSSSQSAEEGEAAAAGTTQATTRQAAAASKAEAEEEEEEEKEKEKENQIPYQQDSSNPRQQLRAQASYIARIQSHLDRTRAHTRSQRRAALYALEASGNSQPMPQRLWLYHHRSYIWESDEEEAAGFSALYADRYAETGWRDECVQYPGEFWGEREDVSVEAEAWRVLFGGEEGFGFGGGGGEGGEEGAPVGPRGERAWE